MQFASGGTHALGCRVGRSAVGGDRVEGLTATACGDDGSGLADRLNAAQAEWKERQGS